MSLMLSLLQEMEFTNWIYNKVLEFHIAKRADITVVCTECRDQSEVERFGVIRMNDDCRIEEFEEKPLFLLIIQYLQVFM